MTLTDENIADYADTWVVQVRASGTELDYGEASVEAIEKLLRLADPELQSADTPQNKRELIIFYNGCYLGEVMARNFGGTWRFAPQWPDSSLVFPYDNGGLQVHPFQKLYRRVTEGPEENDLVDYYKGLKERLDVASHRGEDAHATD